MTPEFPARLHPILARDSDDAVIFRRGPSKAVCTVHWDRRKNTFKVGQWLKGRIYERRSDLSPDGKYLIYFAMNGKWDSETGGSWTAVSRAPYLKAITLFGKGDCWHGGGLFTGGRQFWLNDGHGHSEMTRSSEVSRDGEFQPDTYYGGECTGVYYVRLQRDGWKLKGHHGAKLDTWTVFEKELPKGWVLRKTAHEQVGAPPGKGCYWDEHELENTQSGTKLQFEGWEWAELDGKRIVYTADGKLFRVSLKSQTALGVPKELYDFNDMGFAELTAPY